MSDERKNLFRTVIALFTETFGLSKVAATISFLLLSGIMLLGLFWFFHSAPPSTVTIITGPAGTSFETNAFKYKHILASNGVTLKILNSRGSLENLQRLTDQSVQVDIGFVQGGVTNSPEDKKLVSLGSVSYQPLLVFYRGASVTLLSEFKGKRLAVGPIGSGTRTLALTLLQLNGIETGGASTNLFDLESEAASKALLDGTVDAVFLMGESASTQEMRKLLMTEGIQMMNFTQADGYTRRVSYLNKLVLPKGSIDLGKNIPSQDVYVLGPTVELLARRKIHPALVDLLIEAAQEVHGSAGLLRRKGEFPAPMEHEFLISAEATRYYKSGKSFLYRWLPFRWASLVNRVLLVFVPMIVLLIPGLKVLPTILGLRVRLHIYRWYRALLGLERELLRELTPDKKNELLGRLAHIEESVNKMKVPASFADQFYALRGDIAFVRGRIMGDLNAKPT
jgi:TRAP-type uncharacterized transport system substrate-binding protein